MKFTRGVFTFESPTSLKKEKGDDFLCENKEIAVMSWIKYPAWQMVCLCLSGSVRRHFWGWAQVMLFSCVRPLTVLGLSSCRTCFLTCLLTNPTPPLFFSPFSPFIHPAKLVSLLILRPFVPFNPEMMLAEAGRRSWRPLQWCVSTGMRYDRRNTFYCWPSTTQTLTFWRFCVSRGSTIWLIHDG